MFGKPRYNKEKGVALCYSSRVVVTKNYREFRFRNMGIYKHKVNNDNMSLEEKNKLLESSMPWNFKKV